MIVFVLWGPFLSADGRVRLSIVPVLRAVPVRSNQAVSVDRKQSFVLGQAAGAIIQFPSATLPHFHFVARCGLEHVVPQWQIVAF